ncbi:MAG: hypothetical protein Q9222_003412 [Ikaeria aurantiellina]
MDKFIFLFIHLTRISLSFAAPAGPLLSVVEDLPLNITVASTTSSNEVTLAQNVDNLLREMHTSGDRIHSTAPLVTVFLETATAASATTDVHALRHIRAVFHPYTDQPSPGLRDVITIRNDPIHWDHWLSPQRSIVREDVWDLDRYEIQWDEVQSLMSIEEADALVKAAGYDETFWVVQIGQYTGMPLSYLFFFRGMGGYAVRVDVLTKDVIFEI